MKDKLYVDANGRLWEHTILSGKDSEMVNTPYGKVELSNKHMTEAEHVSHAFFLPLLWTINPAIEVYRNNKGQYAVMLIQQDSMGSSPTTYMSLHGGFCFSEVYAYPELRGAVKTIQLVMKTIEGIWFSYSLYQEPFATAGRILFHCNQYEWDEYRNKDEVCESGSAPWMQDLCKEGEYQIHFEFVNENDYQRAFSTGNAQPAAAGASKAKAKSHHMPTAANSRWLKDVLQCVDKLGPTFTLDDMYSFTAVLQKKHPKNKNIQAKIRQQLQLLRDEGILVFTSRGQYKKI